MPNRSLLRVGSGMVESAEATGAAETPLVRVVPDRGGTQRPAEGFGTVEPQRHFGSPALVLSRAMPLPKRSHVASADQVRITREGDSAIIEYADESVATTHLKVGAEKLASMTDEQLLAFWNQGIEASEDHRQSLSYTATEIPVGKPQVEFFDRGNQWTPRGNVLRCQILSDAAIPPGVDERFVSIDGRDFTLGEFMTMVGTFGGWGMRIEFVPDDELHQRPKLKVREPDATKGKHSFTRKRA